VNGLKGEKMYSEGLKGLLQTNVSRVSRISLLNDGDVLTFHCAICVGFQVRTEYEWYKAVTDESCLSSLESNLW